MNKKSLLIVIVALGAIAAAGLSIYRSTRKPVDQVAPLIDQAVGQALADEVIKALGNNAKIVLVTLEEGKSAELDKHVDAFKHRLYKTPVKIANTDEISSDKAGKYAPGAGMSGKRFVRVMQKHGNVDAIVSFVGTPDGEDEELKDLKPPLPKFFAFSRAPDDIDELFDDKLLTAAIVPRFQFPAPGPDKPKTRQEWFEKYYQVVRASADKANK